MADDKKRVTFDEAKALYPDEWVVFIEPRIDENQDLIDGVVYFHGKDHDEALDRSAEIEGDASIDFTGTRHYEKIMWHAEKDAQDKPADKAA
jgi:hypothetical protein